MNEIILTIIFVLFVTAIVTYSSFRQKKSAWKGSLIDKKIKEDDESGNSYKLIFKTDTGKKVKIQVATRKAFDEFKIGDKYEKKSGEYFPFKI